jgi:hypothetical protein
MHVDSMDVLKSCHADGTSLRPRGQSHLGHRVVAMARRPAELELPGARLEKRAWMVNRVDCAVTGTVLDRHPLADAIAGNDGIVSTLGVGTSREPSVIYS